MTFEISPILVNSLFLFCYVVVIYVAYNLGFVKGASQAAQAQKAFIENAFKTVNNVFKRKANENE